MAVFVTPEWVKEILPDLSKSYSDPELLRLSVKLACQSAEFGTGPFGAVVSDNNGKIVAAGWNRVTELFDSSCHAEIHALRKGQKELEVYDFTDGQNSPYTLFSSAEPCIQCFGATYWSGVKRVVYGASREDVEKLGFDEGPVSDLLWEVAQERKGISRAQLVPDGLDILEPFTIYEKKGGTIY